MVRRTQSVETILVIGATGSIGRLAVAQAVREGFRVRALTRSAAKARQLLPLGIEIVEGDVKNLESMQQAVAGVDAIIFTHGSDASGKVASRSVDYGAVRNALLALDKHPVRIALMTSIGVTNRDGQYNRATEAHDWKRRGERLVRASRMPYTIVRPGWFDYNDDDQLRVTLLQGDKRHAGDPSDGVISRQQIADVLVASLTTDAAVGKTFELVAEKGAEQKSLEPLFAELDPDQPNRLDGLWDRNNMPIQSEPQHVLDDLDAVRPNAVH